MVTSAKNNNNNNNTNMKYNIVSEFLSAQKVNISSWYIYYFIETVIPISQKRLGDSNAAQLVWPVATFAMAAQGSRCVVGSTGNNKGVWTQQLSALWNICFLNNNMPNILHLNTITSIVYK